VRRIGLLLLAGLVAGLPAQAQVTTARPPKLQDAIAQARRFITDTMKVLGAPGASITVIRNGRMIWSEGFGFADVEQ